MIDRSPIDDFFACPAGRDQDAAIASEMEAEERAEAAAASGWYLRGAESFGEYVLLVPTATYPIHVKLFGGMAVQDAVRLRDELSQAIERATSGEPTP